MRLLVTGGCGFIGSNFVRNRLEKTGDTVVNLDALTYAGNRANLQVFEADSRYRFVHGRIEDPAAVKQAIAGVEAVVHFAAESHVDRSIDDAAPFINTNVLGTQVMLDAARRAGVRRFVHVSTDEVYGALGREGRFTEETPLHPRSPYAASKAAGDLLAQAYWETHHLPVMVVRPSNNYGPYQFPEKLIPVMVTNLVEGRKVPVYGRGENVRDWLHVEDCCRGIEIVLDRGQPGEAYNIGGESERHNIDVVRQVVSLMGLAEQAEAKVQVKAGGETSVPASTSTSTCSDSWLEFVPDRPGHDFRYALDNTKIRRELNWRPETKFEDGLSRTVDWYRGHPDWWRPLKERLSRESRGFWTNLSPTQG
ncbi:dTDP-glucose 4,6-dehydratase [candidate division WOR-3 bacterium]|uniref:dTDP-glucose 4,6-dehydratase n=1 Tax=candidate division WOR-3 bacterium TaxID=2052148 RepID=A0A937XER8_UNCW3|nr:dTDP-glucose 4,6-dehydratase [candidate division WOR-3 bacterium]